MTINEVIAMLQEEVKKGNGNREVGFIDCYEPVLCGLTKEECGFYTEEWFTAHEGKEIKTGECTCYILGNLKRIKEVTENLEEW